MGNIILPKTYVANLDAPLIFLAGPIRSAPNWQDEAIEIILSEDSGVLIASPRRGVRENLEKYVLSGDANFFPRQRAWERHYLDVAGKPESEQGGAVLFWLPGEAEHNCQKVYGAMTRIELGQWMANYQHEPEVRFCVGSDGNFPELHTIAYDLKLDAPDKDIKKTLEETCAEALRIAWCDRDSRRRLSAHPVPAINPADTDSIENFMVTSSRTKPRVVYFSGVVGDAPIPDIGDDSLVLVDLNTYGGDIKAAARAVERFIGQSKAALLYTGVLVPRDFRAYAHARDLQYIANRGIWWVQRRSEGVVSSTELDELRTEYYGPDDVQDASAVDVRKLRRVSKDDSE